MPKTKWLEVRETRDCLRVELRSFDIDRAGPPVGAGVGLVPVSSLRGGDAWRWRGEDISLEYFRYQIKET